MPAIAHVFLPYTAFFYYTSLHISSMYLSSLSHADIGTLAQHPSLPPSLPDSIDITLPNLQQLSTDLEHITIAHASGNTPTITELDFSRFQKATTITIGSHCFNHVTKLTISGLPVLERVKIGLNSFRGTNSPQGDYYEDEEGEFQYYNPIKAFSLKSCPKVKSLVLENGVMIDAPSCVIEDVPALEEIVMGDMDNKHPCGCFENGSLELKSWNGEGK